MYIASLAQLAERSAVNRKVGFNPPTFGLIMSWLVYVIVVADLDSGQDSLPIDSRLPG
jgi:hypothetical protein